MAVSARYKQPCSALQSRGQGKQKKRLARRQGARETLRVFFNV